MTFFTVLELVAAYVLIGALLCSFILAVVVNWHGEPTLLDGSRLQSALDDSSRRHLIAVAQSREQPLGLFAAELDEIKALPCIEPWTRWLP